MRGLFGSADQHSAVIFWFITPYNLQFVAAIQRLHLLKPLLVPLIRLQFPLFLYSFLPPSFQQPILSKFGFIYFFLFVA